MKQTLTCAVLAVSLFAFTAVADEPKTLNKPDLVSQIGMTAEIGGGVQQFIDKSATNLINPGGGWTARLVVGTRTHFAGEAAYIGSAQDMKALGVSDTALLVSNGVEGAVRYNVLTGDWQPYALAGYTFRRFTIQNSDVNTSSVADSANVSELPVAIGLAYRTQGFVADLRVAMHNGFQNKLIPDTNLSSISANLKVGFEF